MIYIERNTVMRRTTYQGGAMRKHGTYRAEFQDLTIAHLDRLAHVKVAPMGEHGLVVRKAPRHG